MLNSYIVFHSHQKVVFSATHYAILTFHALLLFNLTLVYLWTYGNITVLYELYEGKQQPFWDMNICSQKFKSKI